MNKTRTLTTDYLASLLGTGCEGSEVCLPGLHKLSGFSRHDGTVGVGNKSVVEVGVGHGSHRVDSTSSSSVGSPGGDHGRGIGWHHGTVGMADQGSGGVGNKGSVMVDDTSSVVEGSLGSGNGRSVSGNHGTVGVTHKLGGGDRHAG